MRDNILIKTKTHKVLTWQGRVLAVFLLLLILVLLWWPVRHLMFWYTVDVDKPLATNHIVIENFDASLSGFRSAKVFTDSIKNPDVFALIFETTYADTLKRAWFISSAAVAGLDTSNLKLLRVPWFKRPRTLGYARAVIDTLESLGWRECNVVAWGPHSARSKSAYARFAKTNGIKISMIPYYTDYTTPEYWYRNETGLTQVALEVLKKIYFDLF
jgi:hypothetical protein